MARSEVHEGPGTSERRAPLRIEALTSEDVDGGLALSDAAGWNQTADDWSLFIQRGQAIGCRDAAGRLVATAATLPYGADAGWISMVLVDAGWRHRGLASALLRECIAHLQGAGATPFLDATPAGAAVYRRLGFVDGFGFERWQSSGRGGAAHDVAACVRVDAKEIARVVALDRSASGLQRRFLLEGFVSRPGTEAWLAADGRGFIVAREGRRAMQIGPLVATDSGQAIALLSAALAAAGPRVFIDVPVARAELAAWLASRGFQRQRAFVRMALGAARLSAASDLSFALAGPEFG